MLHFFLCDKTHLLKLAASPLASPLAIMSGHWVSTDRLGLDVHNVISVSAPHGTPAFQLVDTDVYIFIVLYKLVHGIDGLYVCSRINSSSLEWTASNGDHRKHFVLKFLEEIGLLDMGLPRQNLESCQSFDEKGTFAQRHHLRCFVDDRFECLAGIHHSSPDTELVQYTNNPQFKGWFRANRSCRRSDDFNEIFEKIWVASDWRELAQWCSLPTDDAVWSWLGDRVPPRCDYDPQVPYHCRELFFPAPPRRLVPVSKLRPKSKAAKVGSPMQPDYAPRGHPARLSHADNIDSNTMPASCLHGRPPGMPALMPVLNAPPGSDQMHPQPTWGAYVNEADEVEPQPRRRASPSSTASPCVHEADVDVALPFPPTPQSPTTVPGSTQERMLHSAVSAMLTHGTDVQINISQEGSVSVSTQPMASTSSSTQFATRWSTSKGSKWHECKRIRADKHRAAKQTRLDTGTPELAHQEVLPMCVICHVRQRALRCNRSCCVQCCVQTYDVCDSLEHGVTRSPLA